MQRAYPSIPTGKRIVIIDVLRGFALLGIILAHVSATYFQEFNSEKLNLHNLDAAFKQLSSYFIEHKFFTIFSFLFGYSFAIQLNNAARKAKPFVGKYIWRLILLFLIGHLHSSLFPFDILRIYAVMGLLLLPIRHLSQKTLLIIALILIILGSLHSPFHLYLLAFFKALHIQNLELGSTFILQLDNGHFPVILALFILGLCAGKATFFNSIPNLTHFKKFFFYSTVFIVILKLLGDGMENLPAIPVLDYLEDLKTTLSNIGFSALYVSVIVFLYSTTTKWPLFWNGLAAVGKLGLSSYVIQSCFFLVIYESRVVGPYAGQLSLLACSALLFFLCQLFFASAWLKKFRLGPLEWLWRVATDLQWQVNTHQHKLNSQPNRGNLAQPTAKVNMNRSNEQCV